VATGDKVGTRADGWPAMIGGIETRGDQLTTLTISPMIIADRRQRPGSREPSPFDFTDYGFPAAIIVAIVAESTAIIALTAYRALSGVRMLAPRTQRRTH
jgi:hypothetical protein